ncbi:centrosomal protein of 104 kDa-like [Saccoglossus kowalevskii]|uniref:Centrosomal protein of 104 kDa-like n=1 Tax=Saccoglossus kowalevskii TaxID=10224 RepID=A0ABM0LVX9_SACKO|nr:PREDICTED: centrosomal protein of 104 kDa-like [Saccoglossus kowalevskii]
MPRKIPFSIVHASSSDDAYSVKELEVHNPLVKGWVTGRFCLYPQELVLRLTERARIRKLQILSHQFLIGTKIEFFIGNLPPDHITTLHGTRYKRLGYVSLSDNEKTGFKARELKSVHVDAMGQYLKLVIHKNHVNKYNLFNQVGLVAINVIGDDLLDQDEKPVDPTDPSLKYLLNTYLPTGRSFQDDPTGSHDNDMPDPAIWGAINRPDYISPMDDLAFDMYQDPEVAQIIRKLDVRKNEAVLQERYDLAKRLKQAIADLQKVGEKLGRFEVEKRRAVENEDYDLAKIKKMQMDEYRLQIYKQLELHDLLDITRSERDKLRTPPREYSPPPPTLETIQESPRQPPPQRQPEPVNDERPLPALKNSPRREPSPDTARTVEEDSAGITGEPEPMTEKQMREAGTVIDVFGIHLVSGAFSKTWSYREDAFVAIYKQMEEMPTGTDKEELRNLLRAAIFLIQKGIRDKVFAVFNAALNLLRMILEEWIPKHKIPKQDTTHAVDKTLPELLARTGDTAQRLRETDIKFIVEMAQFKEVRSMVPHTCVQPFKLSMATRLAVSRVVIVEKLLNQLGLEKNSGLTVDNVMKFCVNALDHNAGEVRDGAVRIIFDLYRMRGDEVREHLPPDEPSTRKNTLYRQIFEGFDRIDGRPTEAELKSQQKAAQKADHERKQAQINALQSELQQLKDLASTQGKKDADDESKSGDINIHINVVSGKDGASSPNKNTRQLQNKAKSTKASSIADGSEFGEDIDKMCIFCNEKNDDFNEEGLDLHYWKHCPMLKRCTHCKQVVEISGLTEHLLTECEKRTQFAKCPRCHEAVEKAQLDKHVQEKVCSVARSKDQANRCPLCHMNIAAGEDGWKKHLMSRDGCKNNPRRELALKRAQEQRGKAGAGRGRVGKAGAGRGRGTSRTPRK